MTNKTSQKVHAKKQSESLRTAIRDLLVENRKAHRSDGELAKLVNQRTGGKRDGSKYTTRDVRRARARYNRLEAKPNQRVPKYDDTGKALSVSTRTPKRKQLAKPAKTAARK